MYSRVSEWIDGVLSADIPAEVVAFCFNLYEESDDSWSMELVGAGRFDPDDQDWACDEITDFDSRKDMFNWQAACEWDEALESMTAVLKQYLEEGKYADVLKSKSGVGVGFVDGDIELLYTK